MIGDILGMPIEVMMFLILMPCLLLVLPICMVEICLGETLFIICRDGNGDPIPDSPRGIPLLGDGYETNLVPAKI
jgi:hypothetical protein